MEFFLFLRRSALGSILVQQQEVFHVLYSLLFGWFGLVPSQLDVEESGAEKTRPA